MRIALIPPRGLEREALRSTMHLALAQNMWPKHDRTYELAAVRGDYTIVDNGAAEHAIVTDDELIDSAIRLRATEVVVPDVLKDKNGTIKRSQKFFDSLLRHPYDSNRWNWKFMGVIQGRTIAELMQCVAYYETVPLITTLGIPRHLVDTVGVNTRLEVARLVTDGYERRFKIHLLGTSTTWVDEVYYGAKYYPIIRSVDTSMPFNYAIAGVTLSKHSVVANRPDRYFLNDWEQRVNSFLLDRNVEVLNGWAHAVRDVESYRAWAEASAC